MSCDPSWEICDKPMSPTPAAEEKAPAQTPNMVARDVAVIFANMMWASMLANCYGVGSNSYYVS
jgi:hypothetical protein